MYTCILLWSCIIVVCYYSLMHPPPSLVINPVHVYKSLQAVNRPTTATTYQVQRSSLLRYHNYATILKVSLNLRTHTHLASVLQHPSLLDHRPLVIFQPGMISQSSNAGLDQLTGHYLTVSPTRIVRISEDHTNWQNT